MAASVKRRTFLAASIACLTVFWSSHTYAQESALAADASIGVVVGGIISHHPPAFEGISGGPYLDRGLGGTVPGWSVALSSTSKGGAHLTVEASATTSFEVWQKGRFVTGPAPAVPVLATYHDTMLSLLPGFHWRLAPSGVAIEPKGGFSVMLGSARRGNDDSGGSVAVTAGLDGILPINARIAFVPSFRYSHAFRGDAATEFGLGSHIVKFGFGLRVGLHPDLSFKPIR